MPRHSRWGEERICCRGSAAAVADPVVGAAGGAKKALPAGAKKSLALSYLMDISLIFYAILSHPWVSPRSQRSFRVVRRAARAPHHLVPSQTLLRRFGTMGLQHKWLQWVCLVLLCHALAVKGALPAGCTKNGMLTSCAGWSYTIHPTLDLSELGLSAIAPGAFDGMGANPKRLYVNRLTHSSAPCNLHGVTTHDSRIVNRHAS